MSEFQELSHGCKIFRNVCGSSSVVRSNFIHPYPHLFHLRLLRFILAERGRGCDIFAEDPLSLYRVKVVIILMQNDILDNVT